MGVEDVQVGQITEWYRPFRGLITALDPSVGDHRDLTYTAIGDDNDGNHDGDSVTISVFAYNVDAEAYGLQVFRYEPHPDDGDKFTGSDGSKWIFNATEVKYFCWKAGTTFAAGALYPLVAIIDVGVTLTPA
jgi:hypothetical protein